MEKNVQIFNFKNLITKRYLKNQIFEREETVFNFNIRKGTLQ